MVKRILTTILAITIALTTIAPTTVEATAPTEYWVDIINPEKIGCMTIRGERVYYDENGYLKAHFTRSDGTVRGLSGDYNPKFHNGYIDGVNVGKTDYPYEKTYYYFVEDAPTGAEEDIIAHGYSSYEEAINSKDKEKAYETISLRYYNEYLNENLDSIKKWDEDIKSYSSTNKGGYISTPDNLVGFVANYFPKKTYFYSAFSCGHSNCGYTTENDPFGYHKYHTYLTAFNFYKDHYDDPNGYDEPFQSWSYMSPVYEHNETFNHQYEIEPLGNYINPRTTCQDKNYVEPHRFTLLTPVEDAYAGTPHYSENVWDIKYRTSNPLANLSPEVDVPETTEEEKISVNKVSVNKSEVTLKVNESVTVSATVTPADASDKTVSWTSTNTNVATVDSGIIKAVAPGTTNVKVTSNSDNTKSATIKVTVVSQNDTEDIVEPTEDTVEPTEDVTYKVNTKKKTAECTIVTVKNGVVTIPDTVKVNGKTYKVTSVSSKAIKNPKSVKSITFGKNITTVNSGVFNKCTNLKKLTFKGTNVTVKKNAFKNCKKLTTVKFTNKKLSKVVVGKNAFSKSKTLKIECKSKKAKTVIKKAFKGYKVSVKVK